MKIIELFAGLGACSKALENIGIDVEIIDAVEIDKYAIASFNAIHGTHFKPQDIKAWDKDYEDIDLIMHGSPCQDFSIAGKQAGGDIGSGTRSSLMYETIRIVKKIKPKYIVWENVKNILSKKHIHNFNSYLEIMEELGYNNYSKVLNAKDYGIPQNRERVFTISIRKDIDKGFKFPEAEELKFRLKDMLEVEVDEKYYLSDDKTKGIKLNTTEGSSDNIELVGKLDIKGHDCVKRIYSKEGLSPTLTDMQGGNRQPKIVDEPKLPGAYGRNFGSKGKIENEICSTLQAAMGAGGGNVPLINVIGNYMPSGHDASRIVDSEGLAPTVKENHGTVTAVAIRGRYKDNGDTQQQIEISNREDANAITTVQKDSMVTNGLRIRKLTPKECWRLMGFGDEDFEKAKAVPMSNSQLYKQARKFNLCSCLREDF